MTRLLDLMAFAPHHHAEEEVTIVFKLAIINWIYNLCFSITNLSHHIFKFLIGDFSVSVLVNLFNDLIKYTRLEGVVAKAEDSLNLVSGDDSGSILVEHLEGGLEEVNGVELLLVHGGNDEFSVVNKSTVVGVDHFEHFLDLVVGDNFTVVLDVALLDLLHGETAVTVLVEGLEDLGHLFLLALGEHLGCDVSVSGLLHGSFGTEGLKVLEGTEGDGLVNGSLSLLLDPGVLEASAGIGALVLVVSQELGDEVLGGIGDTLPVVTGEADLTSTHSLHDVVVGLSRKWRSTAQ